MMRVHRKNKADLTIAAIPVPIETASSFGIFEVDEDWNVVAFEEKPTHPKTIPGDSTRALASMAELQ